MNDQVCIDDQYTIATALESVEYALGKLRRGDVVRTDETLEFIKALLEGGLRFDAVIPGVADVLPLVKPKRVEVCAWVEDEEGGSDGAYSLLGEIPPSGEGYGEREVDSFCDSLRNMLRHDWGLSHAKGRVALKIVLHAVEG